MRHTCARDQTAPDRAAERIGWRAPLVHRLPVCPAIAATPSVLAESCLPGNSSCLRDSGRTPCSACSGRPNGHGDLREDRLRKDPFAALPFMLCAPSVARSPLHGSSYQNAWPDRPTSSTNASHDTCRVVFGNPIVKTLGKRGGRCGDPHPKSTALRSNTATKSGFPPGLNNFCHYLGTRIVFTKCHRLGDNVDWCAAGRGARTVRQVAFIEWSQSCPSS